MKDMRHINAIIAAVLLPLCISCAKPAKTIPVITWAGVSARNSAEVFPLLKECGIDVHLGLYNTADEAATALDEAQKAGLKLIPGFPQVKDSTAQSVARFREHPALYAWHLKDEPETWDIPWLKALAAKVDSLDGKHPCYINLYPEWAWGSDCYEDRIEYFASEVDVPFYSFDQYPVTQNDDGSITIRPGWYRNLEQVSAMAKRHCKPFWAFALTTSHHLGAPSPEAFYPVPTLGHLRLQVFSDLLYGAQAIQYFTAGGLYDAKNHCKTGVYDLVKQVNSEIKAYSPVFLGCNVENVWHTGAEIPAGTMELKGMPHRCVTSLEVSGKGAVISLITNGNHEYLAVQNRDCTAPAKLDVKFSRRVKLVSVSGLRPFDNGPMTLEPGNVVLFKLK